MTLTFLMDPIELSRHLADANLAIVDCRFSLDNTERGLQDYLKAHIPGAVYAHLDHDLSGKKIPGKTGRHPLPDIRTLAKTFSAWGINADTQVIVYDDSTGTTAARLWWLLNWMGHRNVAILDGGWSAWSQSELHVRSGVESRASGLFEPREVSGSYITTSQVERYRTNPDYTLLDARSGLRFRGEAELIDPVAGHIPGAVSAPCEENVTPEGRFLPREILRRRFEKLLKSVPPENVICYCGSGITAAHDIFAIAYSGLGTVRLYAGSWSEWITDSTRPIATGME
jgi:thiosulfate/3-mercaptopyruvate sulfurtransferase